MEYEEQNKKLIKAGNMKKCTGSPYGPAYPRVIKCPRHVLTNHGSMCLYEYECNWFFDWEQYKKQKIKEFGGL